MSLEEKIELVKQYKDSAIAALDSYLNVLYYYVDNFFDDNYNFKESLVKEDNLKDFIKSLKDEIPLYKNVKVKLEKNDFNLSLFEINYIALSFFYTRQRFQKQIDNLTQSMSMCESIYTNLISENIPFREEKSMIANLSDKEEKATTINLPFGQE